MKEAIERIAKAFDIPYDNNMNKLLSLSVVDSTQTYYAEIYEAESKRIYKVSISLKRHEIKIGDTSRKFIPIQG